MDGINTVNDWMVAVAEAIEQRDVEALEQLEQKSHGWLQGKDELRAQLALLSVAMEVCYELED